MIQRIQSLWLLLAAVTMLLVFKFPFASAQNQHGEVKNLFAAESLQLFILAILLSLGSLVVIFLFKRRSKQKRIIWLGILVCILYLVIMYFAAEEAKEVSIVTQFKIGSIFPVLYIILMGMAYAAIRNDEKLIRSQRRLRQ